MHLHSPVKRTKLPLHWHLLPWFKWLNLKSLQTVSHSRPLIRPLKYIIEFFFIQLHINTFGQFLFSFLSEYNLEWYTEHLNDFQSHSVIFSSHLSAAKFFKHLSNTSNLQCRTCVPLLAVRAITQSQPTCLWLHKHWAMTYIKMDNAWVLPLSVQNGKAVRTQIRVPAWCESGMHECISHFGQLATTTQLKLALNNDYDYICWWLF